MQFWAALERNDYAQVQEAVRCASKRQPSPEYAFLTQLSCQTRLLHQVRMIYCLLLLSS